MAILAKYDWPTVRDAFVTECPKPTIAELSERFSIPNGTLARVSFDEGWADMRQKRMLELATKSDALEVITKAANSSRLVSDLAANFAEELLGALIEWLPTIKAVESQRAKIDMMNTATFAFQNLSNGCKGFGVVGLPEALKRAAGGVQDGLDGRGQWSPALLQALNVTINTIAGDKEKIVQSAGTQTVPVSAKDSPS